MRSNYEVSVVIPSYASEATVGAAVRSALAQSGARVEVIVIDDGSPEDDSTAAQSAAGSSPHIRIIRTGNGGVSAARNEGIRQARGQLIAFLDADDQLLPGALARHLDAFAADPALACSYGRVEFWSPAESNPGRFSHHIPTLTLPRVVGENIVCTTSNLVVRSDVCKQIQGFREDLRQAEDQEFVARLLLSGFVARGLDRVTVKYRTSQDGLSSDFEALEAGWRSMLRIIRDLAPAAVAQDEAEIQARFHRYAVRRKVRLLKVRPREVLTLLRAYAQCPHLLVREPSRSILTLAGVLVAPFAAHPSIARALTR